MTMVAVPLLKLTPALAPTPPANVVTYVFDPTDRGTA
jgi:hypothetical protein